MRGYSITTTHTEITVTLVILEWGNLEVYFKKNKQKREWNDSVLLAQNGQLQIQAEFFYPHFFGQSKQKVKDKVSKDFHLPTVTHLLNLPILTICTIPLSITPQPRSSIPRTIAVSSPPGTHVIAHICIHVHPYPAFSKTSHPVYPPTQCEWRAICGHRKEGNEEKEMEFYYSDCNFTKRPDKISLCSTHSLLNVETSTVL